ncbi:MAG: hypothetical protein QOI78_6693 [Actinomycetota bacterium]|nr:hypothetical protein [Actinomycetota bacterium]
MIILPPQTEERTCERDWNGTTPSPVSIPRGRRPAAGCIASSRGRKFSPPQAPRHDVRRVKALGAARRETDPGGFRYFVCPEIVVNAVFRGCGAPPGSAGKSAALRMRRPRFESWRGCRPAPDRRRDDHGALVQRYGSPVLTWGTRVRLPDALRGSSPTGRGTWLRTRPVGVRIPGAARDTPGKEDWPSPVRQPSRKRWSGVTSARAGSTPASSATPPRPCGPADTTPASEAGDAGSTPAGGTARGSATSPVS